MSADPGSIGHNRLIYDGSCDFCTEQAHGLESHWHGRAVAIPGQEISLDVLAAHDINPGQLVRGAIWIDANGVVFTGSRAIAKALIVAGGWREIVGSLILTPPISVVAALLYRVVATIRHVL